MNAQIEKVLPKEFAGRYGVNAPGLDTNTKVYLVADTLNDLTDHFEGAGYVKPLDTAVSKWKREDIASYATTSDTIGESAVSAFKNLAGEIGDPFDASTKLDEFEEKTGLLGKVAGYAVDSLGDTGKRVAATIGGRKHARIYSFELPSGEVKYAAEIHTDPSLGSFFDDGIQDGNLWNGIVGLSKAALYHTDITEKFNSLKNRATQYVSDSIDTLFGHGKESGGRKNGESIKFPTSGIGDDVASVLAA